MLERIAAVAPDALVVCAYGVLIREPLLSGYEVINVHPSLLPRWRGAAPVERAIMAGDAETGVSIMRLTEGLDAGPVCLRGASRSGPTTTTGPSPARLQGSRASCSCARSTSTRRGSSRTQRASPTRTRSRRPTERSTRPARRPRLERTVRALRPHIGARVPLPDGASSA